LKSCHAHTAKTPIPRGMVNTKPAPRVKMPNEKLTMARIIRMKYAARITRPEAILPTYMCPIPGAKNASSAAIPGFFDSVTAMTGATRGAVWIDGGVGAGMLVLSLRPQLGQYWASAETSFPHWSQNGVVNTSAQYCLYPRISHLRSSRSLQEFGCRRSLEQILRKV